MGEKKKLNISPKVENFVKAVFTILFSVSLGLNVGKIMRTFVFPLLYLFGAFYYVILLIAILNALYRLFFGHKLKIKSALLKIGFVILLIGVFFLFGYILIANNNESYASGLSPLLTKYNDQLATYYSETYINPFVGLWTNGLIGVLLGGLMGNNTIVLVVGIVVSFIGLSLFLTKPVMKFINFIANKKEVNSAKKRAKLMQEKNVEYEEEIPEIVPIQEEPEEIIIAPTNTKVTEQKEFQVQFGFEPEEDDLVDEQSTGFSRTNISLDQTFGTTSESQNGFSEFVPLSFSGSPFAQNNQANESFQPETYKTNSNPVAETPHYEEPIKNEIIEETQQGTDDFNPLMEEENVESHPINEELVKITPTFANPQPINNNVVSNPTQPIEVKKKKERVNWVSPSPELLDVYETSEALELNSKVAEERMAAINQILSDYKVGARCTSYTIGSSVTRFNIEYDPTVSVKQLEKYVGDISRRLNGVNARFTPIVQGEIYSGLEIPNATITTVGFKEVYEALPDVKKHPLAVGFGKNISGDVIAADFDEFPHLLVAGTTGSGKSIYIHSIIATLIMRVSPDDLKIVLVDPKRVEMTKYRDMPHLLCPIITDASKAKVMLSKLVDEMNNRYELFAVADSCSNIKQYNEWVKGHPDHDPMPYIIVVLDEYADLVDTCKEISQPVVSIAQKARAAGIHMLISTQRPSTNVITGVIKGNLPTHVALMTSSYTDSMTILGEGGAEKLLGKGDMLVQSPLVSRVGLTRLQGCYIQNREIGRIVGYLKEHYETVYDENYLDLVDHSKEAGAAMVASGEIEKEADEAEEAKYQSIKEWVMTQQFVSMSKIQRECGVGFNRAGRFFNRLQKEGIVSTQQDGSTKGCKVLVHDEDDYNDLMVTSDELIS